MTAYILRNTKQPHDFVVIYHGFVGDAVGVGGQSNWGVSDKYPNREFQLIVSGTYDPEDKKPLNIKVADAVWTHYPPPK